MCMIDDGDGPCTVLAESTPLARIAHRCAECERAIRPGETYLRERLLFEGSVSHNKTCAHCRVARDWLQGECGGWVYGAVEEDVREHAQSGYPWAVKRLAVGMQRMWSGKRGLMPLPMLPKTTHERMKEAK
jgi:hypothetical protein